MIIIKPEMGGIAACIRKFRMSRNVPHAEVHVGKIIQINEDGSIKLEDCKMTFPIHSVEKFTFGSVMVNNPKFDVKRIIKDYMSKGGKAKHGL
jgi:hypothetical protein